MGLYIRKRMTVEADPYVKGKGMEDGYICDVNCTKEYRECSICENGSPYVKTESGHSFITEDDVIIYAENGNKIVQNKNIFELGFEKAEED
ncbi:hypothetical protein [Metaclostridioides mangenotii]|uniref:hypothetical protein n=1 Tax=Metaclostridioides mangenotii TaxID=1540 RepID=UPI000463676B|nr:hypothetical protein [Clostridioides mangenotii]